MNREQCGGFGECEAVSPSVFEVQPDGIVMVRQEEVPPEELENVRTATVICPMAALRLSD